MVDKSKLDRERLWGAAFAAAFKYAMYRTRKRSRAEELAAEAVAASLDPLRSPWREDCGHTLSQHAMNQVNELLKSERDKKLVREDPKNVLALRDAMPQALPRPDERIHAGERLARGQKRYEEVRRGLSPFDRSVLDLYGEDLTPAEQAQRLNVLVPKIYEARRNIAERIRGLPDEAPDADSNAQSGDGDDEDRDGEGDEEGEVNP